MINRDDLALAWLRKAESDLTTIGAAIDAGALDTACFHGQQAVEKALKAFLLHRGESFPLTHNLTKLVLLCRELAPEFAELEALVGPLTPYAVELRYDVEFWPSAEDAEEARVVAEKALQFVGDRVRGVPGPDAP